jgi:hypothetical protein
MMMKMSNYKNMKFSNTTEDYRRWIKNFPPLDPDAVKATAVKKYENYYLECQLVQGFITDSKFINTSVRVYDRDEQNFEYVETEKQKELLNTVFKNKVDSFKNKHL